MRGISIFNLFLIPIYLFLPAFVLYLIIKLAVKNAIKELKEEDLI